MKKILHVMPRLASWISAVKLGSAARLEKVQWMAARHRRLLTVLLAGLTPALARAGAVDLQTAMASGNGIIMYVCGTLVAIGIVAAGVAAGLGRQSVAKWALVGSLISGLAFPIVKTMWGNIGLTPPEVSSFTP